MRITDRRTVHRPESEKVCLLIAQLDESSERLLGFAPTYLHTLSQLADFLHGCMLERLHGCRLGVQKLDASRLKDLRRLEVQRLRG